jgi:hypothetical protein
MAPAAWLLPCVPAFAARSGQRPGERAWMERSAALVSAVKARANVAEFRKDVQEHRERLREIVRAAGTPGAGLLELHRSMLLMNALLHAASECHAGGRVQCPPELLQQIEHQLDVGFRQLGALEKGAG